MGTAARTALVSGATSGLGYEAAAKRMTGQVERMDLPHIDDRRAQRAGWNVIVKGLWCRHASDGVTCDRYDPSGPRHSGVSLVD